MRSPLRLPSWLGAIPRLSKVPTQVVKQAASAEPEAPAENRVKRRDAPEQVLESWVQKWSRPVPPPVAQTQRFLLRPSAAPVAHVCVLRQQVAQNAAGAENLLSEVRA